MSTESAALIDLITPFSQHLDWLGRFQQGKGIWCSCVSKQNFASFNSQGTFVHPLARSLQVNQMSCRCSSFVQCFSNDTCQLSLVSARSVNVNFDFLRCQNEHQQADES